MKPRSQHPYWKWLTGGLLLAVPLVAAPVTAAPRQGRPAKPPRKAPVTKPQAAKPAPDAPVDSALDVISRGEETILVDHLLTERPTIVLFYQPAVMDDAQVAQYIRERSKRAPRLNVRVVQLKSLDQPIAKQYEIAATPSGFVYDRNKNLLGKGNSFQELGPLVGRALSIARLKWVSEEDPTAPEVYKSFGGGQRGVPEIMKTMSLHPGLMEAISDIAGQYHFSDGFLTRRDHEIIASYVSSLNKCKY